jgi:hypothetical protein
MECQDVLGRLLQGRPEFRIEGLESGLPGFGGDLEASQSHPVESFGHVQQGPVPPGANLLQELRDGLLEIRFVFEAPLQKVLLLPGAQGGKAFIDS